MSNPQPLEIPYELDLLMRQPDATKATRILRMLYKQKLHNKPILGCGNAPAKLLTMSLYEYVRRINNIHIMISRRLLTFTQYPLGNKSQPGPIKSKLAYMLRTLDPKLMICQHYLILNHFTEIYLPAHAILIRTEESPAKQCLYPILQISEALENKYRLLTVNLPLTHFGASVTELINAIGTKTLPKSELYRTRKLFRDICFETIAYWISDKDLYKLILMDSLEALPCTDEHFISKILQSSEGFMLADAS